MDGSDGVALMARDGKTGKDSLPTIVGGIDAIDGTLVAGWALDRARLLERLEVEVFVDARPVARVKADRLRPDLAKAGVGDGKYGFKLRLARPIEPGDQPRVTVQVQSPQGPVDLKQMLRAPGPALKPTATPPPAPTATSAADLRGLVEEQRALLKRVEGVVQASLREVAGAVAAARSATSVAHSEPSDIDALVEENRRAQERVSEQIAGLEVFIMRFDTLLSDLDRRIGALTQELSANRPMRGVLYGVGFAAGAALLLGLMALFR